MPSPSPLRLAFLLACFFAAFDGALRAGAEPAVLRSEAALQAALAAAKPGDTLVMANGTWQNLVIRWTARGTEAQPITLRAEDAGKVHVTGESLLRLGGEHLVVDGLVFRDGYAPKGSVIEFMVDEQHVATHCRVTNTVIDHYNVPDRFRDNHWVVFYGRHNRLDHCYLAGKLNAGPTVIVELNDERHRENHHRIDHNHFGFRPRLGSNGGETIRIGVSAFCTFPSRTIIERNFFERCSGEVEVISVKSCDNLVRENTLVECEGVIALRHGDRNIVEGNFILGNGKPHTGGIRIVNENHLVRGNHLQDLRGERFFGTLAVMNGVPNSLQNRYMPVRGVLFTGNRIFDSREVEFGVGRDNERSVPPTDCRFEDNLIVMPGGRQPVRAVDDVSGIRFQGNRVVLAGVSPALAGFTAVAETYTKNAEGLYASETYQPKLPVTAQECGPKTSYVPLADASRAHLTGRVIPVAPGRNTLHGALGTSAPGDILELVAGGDYPIERTLEVNHPLTLRSTPVGAATRATIRVLNNKDEVPILQLNIGGRLVLQGVRLDGASDAGVAQAGVATWRKPMIDQTRFVATDCDFVNFDSGRNSAFVIRKGHYADLVSFTNCVFASISGHAISLQGETDDTGRYSAEHVVLRNCLFRDIMGSALDLYRGGNDESTTGPSLRVDHCTFHNVNNVELGSAVRITGAQDADLRNSLFVDSGKSGRAIRLEDPRWCKQLVSYTHLSRSGRIESYYPDRRGPHITEGEIRLQDPEQHDYRLAADSPLAGKASDGRDLGALWRDGVLRID